MLGLFDGEDFGPLRNVVKLNSFALSGIRSFCALSNELRWVLDMNELV